MNVDYPAGVTELVKAGADNLTFRVLLLQAASDITSTDTTVQGVLARAGTTELDSASYLAVGASGRVTLTPAVSNAAGVVNLDFADIADAWPTLDDPDDIDGLLIFIQKTNDADSIPLFYRDGPLDVNGTNVNLTFTAPGPFGIPLNV